MSASAAQGPDGGVSAAAPPRRRRTGRLIAGGVVLVALGAAGAYLAVQALDDGDGAAAATATVATTTAQVERRDLVDRDDEDGTLTYASETSVVGQRSGIVTATAAEGATVQPGGVLYRVDGEPVVLLDGAEPAWRALGLGAEPRAVATRRAGTLTERAEGGTTLVPGSVLYRVDGEPVVLLNAPGVAWRALDSTSDDGVDILWLERNLRALGYDPDGAMTVDQSWGSATTAAVEAMQEDLGATVDGTLDLGDVVFMDGRQRVATDDATSSSSTSGSSGQATASDAEVGDAVQAGSQILRLRSVADVPAPGPDVEALEASLVALGHDPKGAITVDRTYDAATDAALRRFQRAVGMDVDGVLDLGEAVFLDGPQRIAAVALPAGSTANAGAPVLDVTSTRQVVELALDATRRSTVEVGDGVQVTMPDGTVVDGTIASIGAVATTTTTGNGTTSDPTVDVEITLPDGTSGGLDQAPVTVGIVNQQRTGVLAVPVTALLAVSGGGYAVEVVGAGGSHSYVAVEPGLYADGMVEVTGDLAEGASVVVPA